MLHNLKISLRLKLGFAVVLFIALGMVIPVVNFNITKLVSEAESNELKNLYQSAIAEIESEGRLA
jgi:methyl-accepting chemotaxis protein